MFRETLHLHPRALVTRSVTATLIVLFCHVAAADDRLSQYFDGLRERRLFTVAESEAQRRLAFERITPAERGDLTIELSKTYAAHATFSTGDERRELWSRAEEVVGELLRAEPTSAYRGLLMTQRAMVPAARGAQLRWQGELFPLDETTRADAAAMLREALARLRPLPAVLNEDLQVVLATRGDGKDAEYEPAPSRVHQMQREVDFAAATATLDLAKVLPAGADQTAALLEADGRFDALSRSARPDAIAWQARVQRLDVLRLRGQGDRLAGQVASLIKLEPPEFVADAAVAVLVRWWLDEQRPDEALAALEEHRKQHGLDAEELQSLVVETLLSARRLAIEKSDATLAAELLTQAKSMDARLTGPWKVRSALLIEQAQEDERYGPELAASVREARWAWQNGNSEGAIAAYTRAAAQAHKQGEAALAVEFALNTASAQVEAGQFEAAVNSLNALLKAYADDEKAADADLLRAYALGRLYEQQPTDERKEAYRQSLLTHRERYAGRPSAAEATWMLARLYEHDQDWDAALAMLQAVPPESKHYPAAIARLAVLLEYVIDAARQREEPVGEWEQRAVEVLSPIASAFPPAPTSLSIEQAGVAWRLARILMHRTPPEFAAADRLLERVTESGRSGEANDSESRPTEEHASEWRSLVAGASQLRIISLAGQGRLPDARRLLEQVASENPAQMLDVLNGLTEAAADLGIEHRAGIGRMQLELAQQLKTQLKSLPDDQQRTLDMALAQANVAVGQWQPAAQLYEELLWKQPKDREVIAALARLYEECGTASCLEQSAKQWQSLEGMQRKGSVEWLQTRYHLAWCSHRLGDDEAARKLVGVTRVLYPKLGTPTLKAQYEALAAEIEARSP